MTDNTQFTLQVNIIEAKNLRNADSGIAKDVSDPYCKVWSTSRAKETKQTKVVKNNLNPTWNETFTLNLKSPSDTLCFELLDRDTLSFSDSLGVCAIALSLVHLETNKPVDLWLDVIWKKAKHGKLHINIVALNFENLTGSIESGEINLTLNLPKTRSLRSIIDKVISVEEEEDLDEVYGVLSVDEAIPQLETGDILLHSGNGNFSSAIMLATNSMFSHVSMVIRDPSSELRKAYSVPDDSVGPVFIVEAAKKLVHRNTMPKGGVQIVEIGKFLEICKKSEGPTDYWVFRKISVPKSSKLNNEALEKLLLSVSHKPYEKKRFEMIKSIFKKNKQIDNSSYFCSEFIADAMIALGLLPADTVTNNYSPKDFSSSFHLETKLLQGITYAREVRIKSI